MHVLTPFYRRLAVLLAIAFVAAPIAAAQPPPKRIGPDIEDYRPPYDMGHPMLTKAIAAYDAGEDTQAEALARAWLARLLNQKRIAPYDEIDVRYLLALILESEGRYTQAESEYRQGIARIVPLLAAAGAAAPSDKLRRWALYFHLLLRSNLNRQGRIREADLLAPLLPVENQGEESERAGVGSFPGIATTPCPGILLAIRKRTPDEERDRADLSSRFAGASKANDMAAALGPLQELLALDERTAGPNHCLSRLDHENLAEVLIERGEIVDAEGHARAALRIVLAETPNRTHPPYLDNLLGRILAGKDGLPAGEPLLRDAAEHASANAPDSSDSLQFRLDFSANLVGQDKHAEAERVYRTILQSLDRPYRTSETLLELDIQEMLGYLADRQGRFGDAAREYRKVCGQRAELTMQSSRGSLASPRGVDIGKAGDCALRLALALHRWSQESGGKAVSEHPDALLAEAFAASQNALPSPSAEAFAKAVARRQVTLDGSSSAADRYEKALSQRDAAGFTQRPLWQRTTSFEAEAPARKIQQDALNREVAEAATVLAREAPLYWELRAPQPVDLAALHSGSSSRRGRLRKDEALVYLVVPSGSRHGLVFAVSRDSQAWARIGMSGDEIKDAVGRLRRDIDPDAYGVENAPEPDQAEFNRSLAFRLHQALLEDPAIRRVIAPKHTLIFVPTGPLTALPPGLLITKPPAGNDGDAVAMQSTAWLLREHAIAVLPSVAALRLIREFDRQRYGRPSEPLLAFTNPDFAGTGTSPDTIPEREKRLARNFRSYFIDGALRLESLKAMPPLPDTLEEGVALARILKAPVSSVLTGPSASKAELFKRNADGTLARTRILEFATHGLVAGAGDGAAEPALVLAAGKTADDWILSASEASTLRINADWVLLSACNTASPDDDGADGLSGLVRGFFYAGAPALLVSHWTVDDTAVQLVPNAIALRMKGLSRAEALRRASLAILDQPDHRKTNPYYWATFALVGDPD